jgi:hypothetical protein
MNSKSDAVNAEAARFRSTHWSVVLTAAQDHTRAGQAALAELYRIYWYPLYFHVRRRGHSPEDSQDLTQNFFLHLLERRGLMQVDPQKADFAPSCSLRFRISFQRRSAGSTQSSAVGFVRLFRWMPRMSRVAINLSRPMI